MKHLIWLILVCAALSLQVDLALAARKVALVIGNSAYKSSPVSNAFNDVDLMAQTLRTLGFEVEAKKNVTKTKMRKLIKRFGKNIKKQKNTVGLFYYSGHGMQVEGRNYLIPIGAEINDESDVEDESVWVGFVLTKMRFAKNDTNFVFLDACRDNPYEKSFKSGVKGLGELRAPEGTLIAFAAKPNTVAYQGSGKYSYFTEALAQEILKPGVSVYAMLCRVRWAVHQKTDGKQTPMSEDMLFAPFYFNGSEGVSAAAQPTTVQPSTEQPPPVQPRTKTYQESHTGMEFVWVPEGCFDMGQTQKEKEQLIQEQGEDWYKKYAANELPRRRVCVDGFWMGQNEVTVGRFRKFVSDTGYETDADRNAGGGDGCYAFKDDKWGLQSGYSWQKVGFVQEDDYPVACVSWNDVQAFISWINRKSGRKFRLPSEAEWEYAARGGTKTIRYWGDAVDSSACRYANVADQKYWKSSFSCDDSYQFAAPVGKFRKNNFGLYDMLGNVWEWCHDWYGEDYYSIRPRNNPQGPSSGSLRVIRGCSWNGNARLVRSAFRFQGSPVFRYDNLGFRLVLPPGQ